MKTNTLHSINNLLESLLIAMAIIMIGAITTAEGQNNLPKLPNSTLNGVFSPTAAQRFFNAGSKDFEREIDFLANPERYLSADLLQIDEELREQMKETKVIKDLEPDNSQNDNLP